ncbi:MAG: inorganic phosphate transporter [Thermoplasmata archaeon]
MISIIILIELLILTSIVSGNNMSIAIGPLVGSNTLKKDFSKLFGAFGFILGLYFGSKFMNVTFKSLFPQSNMYILLGISATILIFIIAQIARAPLSLTMVLTGIGFGYTLSKGIFSTLEIRIIIMWIIAPLSGFYLSYILMKFYNVLKIKNIWRGLKTIKMLIIIFSFFSSFTLGENTLGLLYSIAGFSTMNFILFSISIIIGSYFLSESVLRRIGFEFYLMRYSTGLISSIISSILVEIATIFGIPLSNTQTMTLGIVGSGYALKTKIFNLKPLKKIFVVWIISPLLGILFGFLFTYI